MLVGPGDAGKLYLQHTLGLGAFASGAALLPLTVTPWSGWWPPRPS